MKFAEGYVNAFNKDVEENRTVEFIISDNSIDRHESRINMKGWDLERFNLNPIVGYQHQVYGDNMCFPDNPDNVLGPGRAYMENDKLIGSVTFETKDINPLAEKIFRKVLNGTLRATSVGFLEIGKGKNVKEVVKGVEKEIYHFAGQELLEFSIVNIPSNANAVGRSLQSQQDRTLAHIMRFMPENICVKDVRKMNVQEVFDIIEAKLSGKEIKEAEKVEQAISHIIQPKRLVEFKLLN